MYYDTIPLKSLTAGHRIDYDNGKTCIRSIKAEGKQVEYSPRNLVLTFDHGIQVSKPYSTAFVTTLIKDQHVINTLNNIHEWASKQVSSAVILKDIVRDGGRLFLNVETCTIFKPERPLNNVRFKACISIIFKSIFVNETNRTGNIKCVLGQCIIIPDEDESASEDEREELEIELDKLRF